MSAYRDKIWVAGCVTNSGDRYVMAFRDQPSREAVAKVVQAAEGNIEELDWYIQTSDFDITYVTLH